MAEPSNLWTFLGVVAVLVHQIVGQWIARRTDLKAVRALKGLRAELTECRARWDVVGQRLDRLESALQLLARGTVGPPPSTG